jgi:hypothetical protein
MVDARLTPMRLLRAGVLLLVLLAIWRPHILWTIFFAPGLAALDMMARLPAHIAARITYGLHPEGGASSAIPLVGLVSIGFWLACGLVLAGWAHRCRKRARLTLPR